MQPGPVHRTLILILGGRHNRKSGKMTVPSIEDRTFWRNLLQARCADLQALIDDHAQDSHPVELDQSKVGRLSRMDALQVQAMAKAAASRRIVELERLERALQRLDDDGFGYCLSCGDEISIKRLEIDPAAPLCLQCAEKS